MTDSQEPTTWRSFSELPPINSEIWTWHPEAGLSGPVSPSEISIYQACELLWTPFVPPPGPDQEMLRIIREPLEGKAS